MVRCSGIDRKAFPDLGHVQELLPEPPRQVQRLVLALLLLVAEAEDQLVPEVVALVAQIHGGFTLRLLDVVGHVLIELLHEYEHVVLIRGDNLLHQIHRERLELVDIGRDHAAVDVGHVVIRGQEVDGELVVVEMLGDVVVVIGLLRLGHPIDVLEDAVVID